MDKQLSVSTIGLPFKILLIIILMTLVLLLGWLLLGTKDLETWLVILMLAVAIKFIEGMIIYQIAIDENTNTVIFRYTFGNKKIKSEDVIEWGIRYEIQHSPFDPENHQIIQVVTKQGSFSYPYKYWTYYFLSQEQLDLIKKVWNKEPQKYLNTKGPVWLADLSAIATNLAFIRL